jgi:hypothetical protein
MIVKKNTCRTCFMTAVILLLVVHTAAAQLSRNSRVWLVTLDPGKEVYYAFGHSGIRIEDPEKHKDFLYNFGVMPDMPRLEFVVNFLKGDMPYMAVRTDFQRNYLRDSKEQNRIWYEQELFLTQEEKNKLYAQLENAVKPENCIFLYNFISRNCATLERDQLETLFASEGAELRYSYTLLHETYRSLISKSLESRPLWKLIVNLLLGQAADRQLDARTSAFIPRTFSSNITSAVVVRKGVAKPLSGPVLIAGSPEVTLGQKKAEGRTVPLQFYMLVSILCALVLLKHTKKTWCRILDSMTFFAAGVFGLLIFILTVFSKNEACMNNYNWIWLNPLYIVFCRMPLINGRNRFTNYFFAASAVVSAAGTVYLLFQPETADAFFLPLILCIRSVSGLQPDEDGI